MQTKVLIVEDEAIVACDIERRLRKGGYAVPAIAASADQALMSIEQTSPDLVLMDIRLQGPRDGIAAATEVRDRFHLPVVLLTAHADKDTLEQAKTAGVFSVLVKPIGHVNLASTIEIALHKHRSELELKSREAWLSTALASMADAVVIADTSGGIQFLNPSAERLTGWASHEAVQRRLWDVVRLVDFADHDIGGEVEALLSTGIAAELPRESRLISRTGRAIEVEGQIAVNRADDRSCGTVLTFRDVTARDREQTQIRQKQKILATSRMANGMSRDFNRLLTVVLTYSQQLVAEMDLGNHFRGRAQAIHRAGYNAALLTGQLLGLCRKESAEPRMVDLNSMVTRNLPLLKRMAGSSVAIETRLDPGTGQILADIHQMEQVLLNLVLNARDAMPRGGWVSIETGNVHLAESPPLVRLAVEDSGQGLNSEIGEHMFEPFFGSPWPGTGTGLGLAVVHAIVTASDGLINVRGKPGEGSLFEIFLPRCEVSAEVCEKRSASSGLPSGSDPVVAELQPPA